MATKSPVTGDSIQTKAITESYRQNFDAIFGKKEDKTNQQSPSSFMEEKQKEIKNP
jgi:hypothetical protein